MYGFENMPVVVVDGKEIRWGDFGRMLMAFEGWQFRLDITDPKATVTAKASDRQHARVLLVAGYRILLLLSRVVQDEARDAGRRARAFNAGAMSVTRTTFPD
ncbi:hypothetical protein BZM27_53150 [Paraburkholderia steynii]|uniref:DUF7713 domain-containing protein n=1 Tax=Paraburkholderia steynii TaxID=1245441 RepID=A0A4R0X2D5_9BURK|nr:hypothetical protein BZM27_53150 [Paraburkholderia steynii]